MRIILHTLLLLLLCNFLTAQSAYRTQQGEIQFNASTPLEDIRAVNTQVNAILKPDNGNFATVVLIKDFQFRRGLMQEHFNENYMESESYPKGYFTGKVENFNMDDLTGVPQEYRVTGKLTLHGETRDISPVIQLSKSPDGILLTSGFLVRPEEYGIKVPKIVFTKIAREVTVSVSLPLTAQ